MSNLLSQASLVMIPSGYKEDVVYSQIPTSGAGDLSFTRASNGTRINSAGLLEVCPWNLLGYSEEFSNAIWTKDASTISSNAINAPNGTLTADLLIPSTTSATDHRIRQSLPNSVGNFNYSVYVKSGGYNWVKLRSEANWANVNLSNGAIGFTSGVTPTVEILSDGWYRISFSVVNVSGGFAYVYPMNVNENSIDPSAWAGNGTSGVYIWGAQLNIGSTAKPYFPTTDRLNVPRLTYQNGGGGCPSLLLEKQSTNLLVYSEQFDQWATNGTTTANVAISPDGTQNADRLNFTSGSIYWLDASINVTNGVSYTYSLYVKPTSVGNQFRFYLDGAFNDSTVITTDSSDWKRYSWTFTASATGSINPHVLLGYGYSSQSILAWGAQLEASSYPTSYIPTTSASATRVADACYKTGISSLIGQTEGTLFINMNINKRVDLLGTGPNGLQIKDTSGNNVIIIGTTYFTNQQFSLSIRNSGSFSNLLTTTNNSLGTYKLAASYNSSGFVFYVNGVQIGTSATPPPSATFADIGVMQVFNINNPEGELVNEAIIFPTRLTNAELASLTTL